MPWYDISTHGLSPRRGNLNKSLFADMAKVCRAADPSAFNEIIPNGSFEHIDSMTLRPYAWDITTWTGGSCSVSTGIDGSYSLRFTRSSGVGNGGGFALSQDFIPICGSPPDSSNVYCLSRVSSTTIALDVRFGARFYDTAFTLVSSRTIASHVTAGGGTTDLLLGSLMTIADTSVHWFKWKLTMGATDTTAGGWAEFDRVAYY